ncbi:MAG: bifunctional phosphopantothenoylcysteine decarboxylase/phosphopantothenate--cysteine ligase CoaBC [Desulfobacterales bacterium]|nr:bifunctional phosphopantothenoylcysteine decarboxylase/phosphopantothenate--cysteine ligase CoaBC [Desulfobacterales bacterium]
MKLIENKNILLGVCGGIAAYKSVELLRLLKRHGANVKVFMTENSEAFVGRLTFEALSGQPVCSSLFEKAGSRSEHIEHIDWAEKADALVIAPATANIIGKIANGIADDALSTLVLAVTSPVIICPSMNTNMYRNRALQRNLDRLRQDGLFVIEPESGELACGTSGPGRLPEPEYILDRLLFRLSPKDLKDKNILVTAGPTQEYIDPVRFLSNPSSGKMGYSIARAAEKRGGRVVLVTGPTSLSDPSNVTVIRTGSAKDMAIAVFEHMQQADIIIKAAAVSDYRPVDPFQQKIKKEKDEMVLSLQKNQDILEELGRRKENRLLVGFAAETENLEKNSVNKLVRKNLDIIVGNLVGHPSSGFGSDTNKVTFFYKDGTTESFPEMEKDEVANILLDRIVTMLGQ